jgi:hypothetical protein
MNRFTPHHYDITVSNYLRSFREGQYDLPPWQREDCWDDEFRKELIKSILEGTDLPKLYMADIIDNESDGISLLDGGHRTRTLNGYINNEYSIPINGKNVFYNVSDGAPLSEILSEDDKKYLDDSKLSITRYDEITTKDARKLFNRLQNAVPMSIADVINSRESPLVDWLRDFKNNGIINGKMVEHYFNNKTDTGKSLPNANNNEDMYQLLSWFTMINPMPEDNEEIGIIATRYLEKGKTKSAMPLKYLKNFDETYDNVSDEFKTNFIDMITLFLSYLSTKRTKVSMADLNTILHSMCHIENVDIDRIDHFQNQLSSYNTKKCIAKKHESNHNYDLSKSLNIEADNLNNMYNGNLLEWIKSRTDGGSSERKMRVRLEMIKEHCLQLTTVVGSELDNDTPREHINETTTTSLNNVLHPVEVVDNIY